VDRSWRDVVQELAGPGAEKGETTTDPEWHDMVVAELSGPNMGWYRMPGTNSAAAWCSVAHALGDTRLMQSLEGAGWDIVEEVIDETTYVVARDPIGALWAIGVASGDADRRGYIERDIGYDARDFDRVAFVEPQHTSSRRAHVRPRGGYVIRTRSGSADRTAVPETLYPRVSIPPVHPRAHRPGASRRDAQPANR
jgi:hypothetical protein